MSPAKGVAALFAITVLSFSTAWAQSNSGEWRFYGSDAHSTKYSALDQINAANVKQLQVAWRWKASNSFPEPDRNWELTPLMVKGVLYLTSGPVRNVAAVNASTGETLWTYRLNEEGRGAVRPVNRGLAYWSDGKGDDRIVVISPGYQLFALNAKTGLPVTGFGQNGLVDLWKGLDRDVVPPGTIGATSPAIIIKDVVVVGAALSVGAAPKSQENVPGFVRGYDVRTGKLLWTFHTIPRPGEFGNETWEKDSWKYTGNTGAWGPLSGDEELGYVYIPVEMPTGDVFGGARPGNNLFADSLVCIDAKTGKRVWHYQLVHHDMWDWDIPAAPVLLDVTVNDKKIKAVVAVTKQAFVYAFDRLTGQPIWPIEERPVPQSDVPGEKTSPTQPFPTKPAAFDRQGVTLDDLIDFTPALKAEAVQIVSRYKYGPIFTPPIVFDSNAGKLGTIQLPGAGGGANWQGAAADPETGMLYIPSVTSPYLSALAHDENRSSMDYIAYGPSLGQPLGPQGLPLFKPPWGRITAINLNTGNHAWMIANGEPSEDIKNNPALKGMDMSKLGGQQRAPLLVTKTMLFAGSGTNFRAINKQTGDVIYQMKLPANDTGGPMSYMMNGRQFIVVATASRDGGELIAFALPSKETTASRPSAVQN